MTSWGGLSVQATQKALRTNLNPIAALIRPFSIRPPLTASLTSPQDGLHRTLPPDLCVPVKLSDLQFLECISILRPLAPGHVLSVPAAPFPSIHWSTSHLPSRLQPSLTAPHKHAPQLGGPSLLRAPRQLCSHMAHLLPPHCKLRDAGSLASLPSKPEA